MPKTEIAWGRKLSTPFKEEVIILAAGLEIDPSHLMAAMAFETGERFSPSIRNPKSGATGLIQFMPNTAKRLGTTTAALAAMTAEAQLSFVAAYFHPFSGRMKTLSDVYMAILWPRAIGRSEAHILFAAPSATYAQNAGLDVNRDGKVTKGEAASKVQRMLDKGLSDRWRG
jgi:hypothetical protein